MNGDVIKSFLVGLGFEVDDASLKKFNASIISASARVTALYAAIKLTTAAIGYSIGKISEGFEQLGYEYRIISPMINKTLLLRREMLKAFSAAGINITKVVQDSVRLNFSLTKTRYAFEAIYKSVASRFFPLLTKQSDIFRDKLYKNMPKIQAGLEKFVGFVFKAFEATVALGARIWSILGRVYDFFAKLHDKTQGWSTVVLGVIAAWNLLNLSFLATPLGMLLAGLTALLALYDDFKTFEEGGKSLFNWGPVVPIINAISRSIDALLDSLTELASLAVSIFKAFNDLFHLNFSGFADRMMEAFGHLVSALGPLWDGLKTISALISPTLAGEATATLAPPPTTLASPLGVGGTQNNQTNQHVAQQTSITVQGSADANSIGKAVAGEQSRVNFDMVRNLKGATR